MPSGSSQSSVCGIHAFDHGLDLVGQIAIDLAVVVADVVQQIGVVVAQIRQKRLLEAADIADRHVIEIALGAGEDHADLLGIGQR
jgi:hypothetical protein